MLLHHVDIATEAVRIIVADIVIPDLFKAAHNAEEMAPRGLVTGIPELAPFLLAVGGGVKIGMPSVEIFCGLSALGIVNPLRKCQMGFHQAFSFL